MKTRVFGRLIPAGRSRRGSSLPPGLAKGFREAVTLVAFCTGIATAPLHAGSEVLLYPFARAFGSPKESELVKCREAFRQFQAGMASNPVVATPVLVLSRTGTERRPASRTDLAEQLAQRVSADAKVRLAAVPDAPAIGAPELGGNQLRYAWRRAAEYAELVKKLSPRTEHVLFTEVWTDNGRVSALHLFLVNPAGQTTYCRWFNSHQFGQNLSFTDAAWIDFAARQMRRDFTRSAEELFPPYGVG